MLTFCKCLIKISILFGLSFVLISVTSIRIILMPWLFDPLSATSFSVSVWKNKNKIWKKQEAHHAESTHKGVNQHSKYIIQVQQQRPESPMVTLIWHACKYNVHKLHQRYIHQRMPGESYHRQFMSLLLYLCCVFWALINSLVCWFWKKLAFSKHGLSNNG